jgi:hypothetical protein
MMSKLHQLDVAFMGETRFQRAFRAIRHGGTRNTCALPD